MKIIQSLIAKRKTYEVEDDPEDEAIQDEGEEDMTLGEVRVHVGKIKRCKSGKKAVQRQKVDYSADASMKQWIKDQRHRRAEKGSCDSMTGVVEPDRNPRTNSHKIEKTSEAFEELHD